MKTRVRELSIIALWMLLAGVLLGCSGGTVPSDLALIHPAHPQAPETAYSPPPNPFQDGLSEMKRPDQNHKEADPTAAQQRKMGSDHGGHSIDSSQEGHTPSPPETDHSNKPHGGHGQ